MFDAQHAKRPENDRSSAGPVQKTSGTKQRTPPHTADLTRLPRYTQAWGNLPPPWLRLPSPPQASTEQPLQRQTEEGLQNERASQQMNEPGPAQKIPPAQRREPPRMPRFTQAWGNQPPPWLRLPVQRKDPHEEEPLQEKDEPLTQRTENTTGLPDTLKAGVEQLSGISMDDVQVHYNSPKPAEVQALAYTQGTYIHVAPGQERHLAHEAWHAVQQKQGRVQPTLHARGVTINDDQHLEREADTMGGQALQYKRQHSLSSLASGESDKETDQLATGRMTQLKEKNALTSSHSASSRTPDTETVVQMVEPVPKKGTKMKVQLILEKLDALIKEAAERRDTLEKMRFILTSSFAAIENPHGDVKYDKALKVGALASYIKYLMDRIGKLTEKRRVIENEHSGISLEFDFGVEELPDILNAENLIATGPVLENIELWFGVEVVTKRKKGHKLQGELKALPPAPGVTPEVLTEESVEHFLRLPAAPLLNVSYVTLKESIGDIEGWGYQGLHDNKEKNLPTPQFQHKCQNLIELYIFVPALQAGRAVVDIETGKVYITEHYGQNIVKPLMALVRTPNRTVAQNQELQALLFLKKLINDFVLVTDIPVDIYQGMMKVACSTYLANYVALEQFNPPPTGIAFQKWCLRNLDILEKVNVHTNPIAWTRWMLYCHDQPQQFLIPDGCPLDSDFKLLTPNPELPVLCYVSDARDFMNITASYGQIVILETRIATVQNKRVCLIKAGSFELPQWINFRSIDIPWIKFGEVPIHTSRK